MFDQDADDVVGMVHRRDLMAAMARQQFDATMESMMGPIDFVAGTMGIDRLLHRFLHHRTHLSMVIDEFGSLAGLVTLEDTLEALLGYEIVDEYDPAVDMRELAHDRRRELQSPDDT
ncbi:MAG: CBS domain-containing protein [Candidatus Latescibacterota bacterium]|nr:CBS domain-containing protein [Candidatus Latescibacterota bacterium]